MPTIYDRKLRLQNVCNAILQQSRGYMGLLLLLLFIPKR